MCPRALAIATGNLGCVCEIDTEARCGSDRMGTVEVCVCVCVCGRCAGDGSSM